MAWERFNPAFSTPRSANAFRCPRMVVMAWSRSASFASRRVSRARSARVVFALESAPAPAPPRSAPAIRAMGFWLVAEPASSAPSPPAAPIAADFARPPTPPTKPPVAPSTILDAYRCPAPTGCVPIPAISEMFLNLSASGCISETLRCPVRTSPPSRIPVSRFRATSCTIPPAEAMPRNPAEPSAFAVSSHPVEISVGAAPSFAWSFSRICTSVAVSGTPSNSTTSPEGMVALIVRAMMVPYQESLRVGVAPGAAGFGGLGFKYIMRSAP